MSVVIKLPEFEGAFDLLLHLIKTNEMEIEGISVLAVIDQYVDMVADYTLDQSSDFILMASHLIALKARYLNKGKLEMPTEGAEDPLEQLVEKLKVYRKIKQLGEYLKNRESLDYHFFKEAEIYEACTEEEKYNMKLLSSALQRVMDRLSRYDDARQEFFRLKRKQYVSVKERREYILKLLGATNKIAFTDICETRDDVVASFLAILELLKHGRIKVYQDDIYTEIYITAV